MEAHIDRPGVRRPIGLRCAIREAGFLGRLASGIYAPAIGMEVVFAERASDEHRVGMDVPVPTAVQSWMQQCDGIELM